jgi:YVTN family beta-propeller protein
MSPAHLATSLALALALPACGARPAAARGGGGRAGVSGPIALSPDGRTLWVANPDADSVTPVDVGTLRAGPTVPVGREPWGVAVAASGQVLVLNRADGTLTFLGGATTTTVPVGPEPGGLALSPSTDTAYVTVSGTGELVAVDLAARAIAARIPVGRMPWSVAVAPPEGGLPAETVVVSHRLARLRAGGAEGTDDGKEGWLSLVDPTTGQVRDVPLPPQPFGFPNGLEGLAVTGATALSTHLLDQPAGPRDFQNTVSAALSAVDLAAGAEIPGRRIHLNDPAFSTPVNSPRAVALSPDGRRAYLVLAGSDAVMGIDLAAPERPRLLGFWPTGRNPRGIVLDRGGARAYVMNYLSRDVSVLDLEDLVRRPVLATVAVAPETLAPELLRGKILFHKANDPRISHLGWLSCGSCHLDGGVDGTTWLGPNGPRQTQPLWRLEGTAPFHASATRDEVQDSEVDIEGLLDGVGLSPGTAMPELGEPNGGRSADLDALARFALEGVRVPRAAPIPAAQEARGRELFRSAGCVQCHAGPHWTVSALPAAPAALSASGQEVASALRDVGTAGPADVLGAAGFDVPTLLGLSASAPYLHDGSAQGLAELLGNPRHAPPLPEQDLADLVAFLGSIDGETAPVLP